MRDHEQRRRIVVERARAKVKAARAKGGLAAGAILRTCACGRTLKGNGFFLHIKVCVHAQCNEGEKT